VSRFDPPESPDADLRPPVAPRGTLPPQAKILKEIFAGLERLGKELGLPVLCIVAGKYGLLEPKEAGMAFLSAVSVVLGGNFALRRGEHKDER